MSDIKFSVTVEFDISNRRLEIIPSKAMVEWFKRTKYYVSEIKLEQLPFHEIPINPIFKK